MATYSRFLLGCQSLPHPSHTLTQPVFTRLFLRAIRPAPAQTDPLGPILC
jgi:hypothetical protein